LDVSACVRFRSVSVVAAGAWLAFAAAAAAGQVPPPRPREPLRVLIVPDQTRAEFFSAEPSPAAPGFERELLDGFARTRYSHIEAVGTKGWDELVPALEENRGDLIAGHFTITPDRERHVTFTDGVLPTRTVVITRKPDPPITNVEALRKLKIAVVKGSASLESLLAAGVPRAQIDDSSSQETLLELLRSKKVNAVARSAPLAILNQREDADLQIGVFAGPASEFAWAVRRDNTALRDALNEHLKLARRTGAWNRLVVKYFGQSAVDILKQAESR
jgi:polar amino acid transport system substrate-binding protein